VEQIPGVRVLVAAYGLAGDPVDVGQAVQPAAGQDEHTPAGADVNRAQTQSHPFPHDPAATSFGGVVRGLRCGLLSRSVIPAVL
jgi:hypothetical protein